LDIDPATIAKEAQVSEMEWQDEHPWSQLAPPIALRVPARRVIGWVLDEADEVTEQRDLGSSGTNVQTARAFRHDSAASLGVGAACDVGGGERNDYAGPLWVRKAAPYDFPAGRENRFIKQAEGVIGA
jgi:hypothetical protein